MTDSEIEDLLRRYRPIGPPLQLRERILATTAHRRIWPWAGAAAALLVIALGLQAAAGNEVAGANMMLGPDADVRVADDLTVMLGGGAEARAVAEFIIVEQQVRSEATGEGPR